MNKNLHKLIFCRVRRMVVAVAEFATSHATEPGGGAGVGSFPVLRAVARAAMVLVGTASTLTLAQIVPSSGSGAQVLQTQNGLQQVNIAKPSAAGVSLNSYSQFDVPGKGAILNNSPTIVQTQQAGYVNGNPNLAPGQSAGIIVNQVLSNSPSQLRGYLEVAGPKAEVIVANPSGILVDGGGFINTSRAILTTGTPNFGANGSLAGFNVAGGNITVQGAGLNATNVDQVDLLARAIQVNAAIYANKLNVVAGANQVDHNTLSATPIAGNGAVPAFVIDVSQLGGMYANRIYLASNEYGVGVSNRGVLAAQAGDLTLTSQGKLVLAGQTNASGSINASARDGIDNSGTTYAQRDVIASTWGALTNSGVLAAQGNTAINANSVASTGTLGAGVNSDGSIGTQGDLNVIASGAVSATGRNEGGGNTVIQGASVNLAGSNTSANGVLSLAAISGDMNLANAATTAGGALNVSAAGTLVNDGGKLSSGGAMQVAAGNVSNAGGQIVTQSTLDVSTNGAVNNAQGVMQAAGRESIRAASVDNTAGRIVSLNADGLNVTTTGALVNGAGGTIGTNGALGISAGTLSNQGQLTASGDATVNAQSIDNHAGSVVAGGALNATAAGVLSNVGGKLSGATTTVSAASIDNTSGDIEGDALAVSTPGALVNRGGKLTQFGAVDQSISAGGALDNTGGTIASNATNLSVSAQGITNDSGTMQHAGAGTLVVTSKGALSNAAGNVVTNGALALQAALALNNAQGTVQAAGRADVNAVSLDNTAGRIVSLNADGLKVTTSGALVNGAGGTIGTNGALDVSAASLSNQGQLNAATNATLNAQSIDNHGGSVVAGGALNATTAGALNNAGGTLSGATTTLSAASIDNTSGDIEGDTLAVSTPGTLINRGGKLTQFGSVDQSINAGGALDNTGGTIASNATNLSVSAQSIMNDSGTIQHAGTGTLAVTSKGALSNAAGSVVTNGALALQAALALNNTQGTIQAARRADLNAASLDNTAGRIVSLNADGLNVTTTGALVNGAGGMIGTNGALDVSAASLSNQGQLNAATDATLNAQSIDNHEGSVVAGGALNATTAGALNNAGGTLSGATTTVSAASIDNTSGDIEGDVLAVSTPGDLINRGGKLTQYSAADQSITAGGALDNTGGLIASNANNLSVNAQAITNDSGTIQHAGSGALAVTATGALSNAAGSVQTNGALIASGASLNNASGTLLAMKSAQVNAASGIVNRSGSMYGGNGLSVGTQGDIDNTGGSMRTAGDLSIVTPGTLTNAQGTISANGAHGTANVSAARIDNTSGKLTNAGDGATSVSASDVTNTGGTLGGNGDVTVNAQTLENDANAALVAGGAANLNVAQRVINAGGTLFGGTALNLNQAGANVINDGGAMLGGLDVSVNVASLSNVNGSIRANRDVTASGVITGDGAMIAGRNLGLAVIGDYVNDAANNLHADGDMNLSATGTLTNTGTLGANGALLVSAQDVVNAASGDINSSNTRVNAAGTIDNAGRIEGDTVATQSATIDNTGTVIGNDVTVNANDVNNTGSTAAIAGANSVHLYAANSVNNTDGALIYSLGNLEIAKDGTRDASGMLANQTNALVNSAATIEADGDIDIAARSVQNIRTGVATQAGTPQDAGSTTLTLWTAGLSGGDLATYHSSTFPEWNWNNGAISDQTLHALANPVTVTVPKDQVTNIDASAQTFSLTVSVQDTSTVPTFNPSTGQVEFQQTSRVVTNNAKQWYNSLTDNGDGTVSITFWPDFDPGKNIRPDQAEVRWDIGNHDYLEMSRTTQTTTTTDQLVSAGNAAMIQAQGTMRINADGGSIVNDSSTMAAGGDLVRRATGGSVTDTGTVLQQTIDQTTSSIFYWHQKTGGSSDTTAPRLDGTYDGITSTTTTVDALPAIASSNQNVQTNAATININSIDRQGQTVIGSGVTGGSADGTQTGAIAGKSTQAQSVDGVQAGAVAGQSGQTQNVSGNQAQAASGQSSAPQTVGGATGGIPNLKLPVNGLYTYNTAPNATFLIATDPRLTQYAQFISSDYMLKALDFDPAKVIKRLGDGAYEEQLVRNQVTQLTGRTFLDGYTDNLSEYTALMNNGVTYAKQFGLTPGIALTADQMARLTTDMVWLVEQDVTLPDGSHQTVLVPTVYLAQADTVDLKHSGALVTGNGVTFNASGDVTNSGHVTSNLATTIIGNNVVNSGVIGSGGTTAVVAVQDVRNTSGRIGGSDVIVQAGRDIINETQTHGIAKSFTDASFSGRTTNTSVDAIGTISATNSATVIAGRDVNLNGALIQTGGDASIAAGRDVNVGTTTLTSTKDSSGHDGQDSRHDTVTQSVGSAIVAGGDVTTFSARDTTLSGATISAGGDAAMIAGRDMTVTASKDTRTYSEQSLSNGQSQHANSSYDERVNGSSVSAGGGVTLAAGQNGSGNLAVMASNVTADKGGVALISTGDVTIGSVNETHDAQGWSHSESSGFLSKSTTSDANNSHQVIANGSTISGDTVQGAAGHDMTISGSTVAATNDVTLSAANNLTINTTQDTKQSSTFHEETHSGLGSSGLSVTVGTNKLATTDQESSVTNNASTVGSLNGNLSLQAGNTLHATGSDLIAGQDVTGKAANVIIDAATDKTHRSNSQETSSSGMTIGLAGSVGDAINNAYSESRAVGHSADSGNDRAAALHAIAAAGDTALAGMGAASAAAGGKPDIGVKVSFGSSSSRSDSSESQTTNRGANVQAGGTAKFVATGDGTAGSGNVTIAGSNVSANDVVLAAKNQVNVINTTDTDSARSSNSSSSASVGVQWTVGGGWGVSAAMSNAHGDANSDAAIQNASHVRGANSVTVVSGGDTNIVGSQVAGKQVTADIGGNLNIASVQDTTVSAAHQSSTSGGFTVKGGVKLVSTGDVTFGSVSETHDAQGWSHSESSGFLSKSTTSDANNSHQVIANGSTISGDTVQGAAGHDMTISGSTVAATNDVTLSAANNLTINTTQDTKQSSTFHEETHSGLGYAGGAGISYGNSDQKDTTHDASVTNNGSLVGSTDGSVHLSAGSDLHVTGSDLIAAQNVTGTGANVTIDAATDTAHHDEKHEFDSSGFTLAIKAPVLDALTNTIDQARAAGHSEDDRAAALHGIAAASGAFDAGMAGAGALGAMNGGNAPQAKVELSYGSSHSESTYTQDTTTSHGSNVVAGGTATFVATGNAQSGSGNVTIAGSNVNADDVILKAKNQVNLVSSSDTDSNRSTNESSSGSIGVSYGTQGWGVDASMSKAHGNSNSDTTVHNNTHINASNSATIVSGGDTNIVGADVTAKQVTADIGGNLNIASEQDTSHSAAHQSSAGGGFSVSQGGASGSVSVQNGNAHGDYAGVNEQSGIRAGEGGFDINVKGNTDLKGAVIASDADASKNTLNTGTLTFSDIQNHSDYTATSTGISAGASSTGGSSDTSHGPASVPGAGGAIPTYAHDSGNSNATTRGAISAGTITITDNDRQAQDVSSLSRDAMNTNGTVSKLPDVNEVLGKQADLMNATAAAGEAVAKGIGQFADSKRDDALADAKAAYERGDLDAMQGYLDVADSWSESGSNRIALHVAGGGLIGGLGGGSIGSAAQGAAGAGISAAMADQTKRIAETIADETGSELIGQFAGNTIDAIGGGIIGGTTAAAAASNVNLYNQWSDNKDSEAKKETRELRRILDKERAALGQKSIRAADQGAPTVNVPVGALTSGRRADAANGLNLNKSLASQQQFYELVGGKSINIAGGSTGVPLRDVPQSVSEYGG